MRCLLILLSALLFSGCVFRIPLEPNPRIAIEAKISIDLGLFVEHSNEQHIYKAHGLTGCLIGNDRWEFNTGIALKKASEKAFRQVFRNVTILNSIQGFWDGQLTILILPKIRKFEIKNSDMQAKLYIHCRMVDRLGNTIYERDITRMGSRKMVPIACCLGATGGGFILSRTSQEAFNKAFEDIAVDMVKNVDFAPYLEKKGNE